MTERDDRLQEHLEALDAGEALDRVLASANDEDAGLLRLASAVRAVEHPAPARRAMPALNRHDTYAPAWTGENENGSAHPLISPARHARSQGLMSKLSALGLSAALIMLIVGAAILLPRLSNEPTVAGPEEPTTVSAAEQPTAEATEPTEATEAAPPDPLVGWLWCGYDPAADDDAPNYELPPGRENAVESVRQGFWMAYPQSWEGLPGTCDRDRVAFISPETRTEVRVWVWDGQGGPDWLEKVKQRWEEIMVGVSTGDPSVVESNVHLRDRDALLACQPSHPGMGTVAALVFPDGDDLIAFYLYVGGDPTYWQAEADIFETMLASFSLGPEPSVSDFTFPDGAWCESYEPVSSLWGRVGTVAASDAVIVLAEPAKGFVTVSLGSGGELVDAAGQPIQWADIPPGAQIEATGAAGEAGDYVAERIVVHAGPTSTLSAPPPGLLFVLEEETGGSSLWLTDANGEAVRLYELPERLAGSELDVSPAGDAVLFRAADDIWRLDLATGQAANITQTADRREGYPRWLPDGSSFVCGSQPAVAAGGPTPGHLTLVTFDGTYEVLDHSTYLAAPPAPSPDGTTIAYSRTARSAAAGESFALYRFGEGVVEPETAGAPLRNVGELSWSPDSTRLAVADSSEGYAGVSWFKVDMRIPYGLEVYKPAGIGGALPAPVWQPSGERLALNIFAAEASESGLQFYAPDERGRYTRELFIPNTTPSRHPAFMPGGRILAYPVGANEVYVVDMATYEISVWHALGTVSAVGWAETAPVAPVTPPTDGPPADVADWVSYELPDTGVTVPLPPGWTVAEWPVDDTVPFAASVSVWPQWDRGETPPPGQPEISVTVWPRPAGQALREWLDAHSTAAPFGTDTGAEDEITFFGVRDVEETTLGGQPALGFTRDVMGVQVLTIIAEGPAVVVGLSKTHADQFPLGPVFDMMQALMHISPAR